jgi:hypothetical protein
MKRDEVILVVLTIIAVAALTLSIMNYLSVKEMNEKLEDAFDNLGEQLHTFYIADGVLAEELDIDLDAEIEEIIEQEKLEALNEQLEE